MRKNELKAVYVCQECGKENLTWLGRCPHCQGWNSLVETVVKAAPAGAARGTISVNQPREISAIDANREPRMETSSAEFNRAIGGGLVPGSLVLIGGDPGIGKSTLVLKVLSQAAGSGARVLYVSGEESAGQVKLRAERLGVKGEGLFFLSETSIDEILLHLEESKPRLVAVDSIQTVFCSQLDGAAGSVGQIRECTLRLMRWAKEKGVPVLITGHVTKDGAIAGPKVLEHMVDVVLYLEGEPFGIYRILRAVKNRFGSINEVGVFEMGSRGLIEVDNPSAVFISEQSGPRIGSVVVPTLEGSRPLLVEIQALTSTAVMGPPRRLANGVDMGRLWVVAAVLSRWGGLSGLSGCDIMVNVTGGLRVQEPSADLGMALAIASSFRRLPLLSGLVSLGEIGLSGEIRSVPQMERRLREAERLKFRYAVIPQSAREKLPRVEMEIKKAGNISEAIKLSLMGKGNGGMNRERRHHHRGRRLRRTHEGKGQDI